MSSNKYCIIMAGGVGTRFWPRSRQSMPKQFLDILGCGKTLLQDTYDRFAPIIDRENFIVLTNRRYRKIVLEQLPELREEQVLCEPIMRNTAPAVCYAAYSLLKKNPDAEMIITPSDHYVSDVEAFRGIINECVDYASANGALMTVGIKPTRAETGYGYIQVSNSDVISRVKSFTEKPILEMAETFVECGEFFWNTGIFVWTAKAIVEGFERYMPDNHNLFSSIMEDFGTQREGASISRIFSECRATSIDFGVLERADNVYVRVSEFGWCDVGSWGALHLLSKGDKAANVSSGKSILHDCKNLMISLPEGKIAMVNGLSDYIVVDTDNVLLICPRSEEHNIKNFIDEVKYQNGDEYI